MILDGTHQSPRAAPAGYSRLPRYAATRRHGHQRNSITSSAVLYRTCSSVIVPYDHREQLRYKTVGS